MGQDAECIAEETTLVSVQRRCETVNTVSFGTRAATGLPVTFYNNNETSLLGSIPNGINNNGLDTPGRSLGELRINNNPAQ